MSTQAPDAEDHEPCDIVPEARPRAAGQRFAVFDAVGAPSAHPVSPTRLDPRDSFRFGCHRGLACWNSCCHGADITLTPYDIVRLSRRLGLSAVEFLSRHTVPAYFPKTELPVAKIKMGGSDGKGPCPFMAEPGCTVYDDRPATCRFYPLGLMAIKLADSGDKEDFHFLVEEPHCRGHGEAKTQAVFEFRHEQGIDTYDAHIRGWIDILMKMASWSSMGGPGGKKPTPQMQKMFFLATTDVQGFREFVFGSSFLDKYAVPGDVAAACRDSDEALLDLAYAWLKTILFNEPTLPLKDDVLADAVAKARRDTGAADR